MKKPTGINLTHEECLIITRMIQANMCKTCRTDGCTYCPYYKLKNKVSSEL